MRDPSSRPSGSGEPASQEAEPKSRGWINTLWDGFKSLVTLTEQLRRVEVENGRLQSQVIEQGKMIAELGAYVRGLSERLDLKIEVELRKSVDRLTSEGLLVDQSKAARAKGRKKQPDA